MQKSDEILLPPTGPHWDVFRPNAELVQLYTGAVWTEGPVYFAETGTVIFSDIPNNRLLEWSPSGETRIFDDNSHYTNGNTLDREGCRISCQHLTNSVVRFPLNGPQIVLASHYAGNRLNSPNDVVVAHDGGVWFTDPTYGILSDHEGRTRTSEQEGCFVYRIDPVSRECQKMCDSLMMPNGLAFSIDQTILYIADSSRSHFENGHHHVFAFDVLDGKTLSNKRTFYEVEHGVPDGMRIDAFDNLWCSSARGVEVIDPEGQHIGHIPVPEPVANLTFGGRDGKRLFITATTSLYAIDVAVRGIETMQNNTLR